MGVGVGEGGWVGVWVGVFAHVCAHMSPCACMPLFECMIVHVPDYVHPNVSWAILDQHFQNVILVGDRCIADGDIRSNVRFASHNLGAINRLARLESAFKRFAFDARA